MNRGEFERIRDWPGKVIRHDIVFAPKRSLAPLLVAEVEVENTLDARMTLTIHFNPEVGSKSFNVRVEKIGPICRLDLDGPPHRPLGRSHKHSLREESCPKLNLPSADDASEYQGLSLREAFAKFCDRARIKHEGSIEPVDDRP